MLNVPYIAIVSTISERRTDTEMSKFLGMSYSAIMTWSTKEYYFSEKRYQVLLMDFFRKINIPAVELICKEYDLFEQNDYETIANSIMPMSELESFMKSSISWKQKVLSIMLSIDRNLFVAQCDIIKTSMAAVCDVKNLSSHLGMIVEKNEIPEEIFFANTAHLKDV